jgi:hypothetical protein
MSGSKPSEEVQFQPKSGWQKDDCINDRDNHRCYNPSTLEAVDGSARVRCCIEKDCKKTAAIIALACKIN